MVCLADGDRAALPLLVDELWPSLLSFVSQSLRGSADAEDVAQEAFVRVCGRIGELDRERDGVAWAFGIASFEVMTQRRRIFRRRELLVEPSPTVAGCTTRSPEDDLLAAELAAAFVTAVGALSDSDRKALGLAQGEAAAGAAGTTRRKRRQRALDRLREIWRSGYGQS